MNKILYLTPEEYIKVKREELKKRPATFKAIMESEFSGIDGHYSYKDLNEAWKSSGDLLIEIKSAEILL